MGRCDPPAARPRVFCRARIAIACVAVGFVGMGCNGGARRETSMLIDAVDRYRQAPPSERQARERAVASLGCSAAAVCDAKRVCLDAIGPTTRALDLKDEVIQRLGDLEQKKLDPSAPEAAALPQKLDEASALLAAGRAKMTECERGLAELRVKFGS